MQHAVVWANGYPAHSALGRKPLPLVSEATKAHVEAEFADIVKLERQLEKEGNTGLGLRSDAPAVGKKDNGTTNGTGLLQSLKETVAAV